MWLCNQLYKFCRVPFGLKTSGPAFIRALSLAVHKLSNYVTSYIDDLLIASRLFEEHVEHLKNLFICIKNAGFTLSFKKSLFFRQSVPFLGFVLDAQGIRAAPERLEAIENSPIPVNKQHLQAFLGVCGYYRRFVVRHANYPRRKRLYITYIKFV